jgi:hypothetical protein
VRLAQTFESERTTRTIFLSGAIDVIHPMANAMAMRIATQDLAMRTDIRSFGFIKEEISFGEKALFPVF